MKDVDGKTHSASDGDGEVVPLRVSMKFRVARHLVELRQERPVDEARFFLVVLIPSVEIATPILKSVGGTGILGRPFRVAPFVVGVLLEMKSGDDVIERIPDDVHGPLDEVRIVQRDLLVDHGVGLSSRRDDFSGLRVAFRLDDISRETLLLKRAHGQRVLVGRGFGGISAAVRLDGHVPTGRLHALLLPRLDVTQERSGRTVVVDRIIESCGGIDVAFLPVVRTARAIGRSLDESHGVRRSGVGKRHDPRHPGPYVIDSARIDGVVEFVVRRGMDVRRPREEAILGGVPSPRSGRRRPPDRRRRGVRSVVRRVEGVVVAPRGRRQSIVPEKARPGRGGGREERDGAERGDAAGRPGGRRRGRVSPRRRGGQGRRRRPFDVVVVVVADVGGSSLPRRDAVVADLPAHRSTFRRSVWLVGFVGVRSVNGTRSNSCTTIYVYISTRSGRAIDSARVCV
mmetsp:Transcript_62091/g.183506  ORF Transcript_62091/g.183506 Transcript_62091/m.183506 type:complete len:456 (+) Transcript_62091:678-2045(+)